MNATDQGKILDAGFVIIRQYDRPVTTQTLTGTQTTTQWVLRAKTKERREWHQIGVYTSQTQRRKFMDVLLKGPLTVED